MYISISMVHTQYLIVVSIRKSIASINAPGKATLKFPKTSHISIDATLSMLHMYKVIQAA